MRQRTEIAPFVGSYGLNLCETKPKHGILGKKYGETVCREAQKAYICGV